MMFYEYPIIFGFLLAVIEAVIRLWSHFYGFLALKKSKISNSIVTEENTNYSSVEKKNQVIIKNNSSKVWQILTTPEILLDILVLIIIMGIYIIFRLKFPSQYEGNSLGYFDWKNTLYVQFFHAIGGISPAHWNLRGQEPLIVWIKSIIIGLCLAYVVWLNWKKSQFSIPTLLIFLGIVWSFIITLPFGLSAKYQQWCLEYGDCYYIDSRLAFPGICLIIIGVIYFVPKLIPYYWVKNLHKTSFAILIFWLATVTSLSNYHAYNRMAKYQQPFDLMTNYSCLFLDNPEFDDKLLQLLNDLPQIEWHEELTETKLEYIQRYLQHNRAKICQ